MRYKELFEKIEMIEGIKVLITPTVKTLRNFIRRIRYKEARGLFDGRYFYFWDSAERIHDNMAESLGLANYTRLVVKGNDDDTFDIFDDTAFGPRVDDNPYYLKLRREG